MGSSSSKQKKNSPSSIMPCEPQRQHILPPLCCYEWLRLNEETINKLVSRLPQPKPNNEASQLFFDYAKRLVVRQLGQSEKLPESFIQQIDLILARRVIKTR